MNIWGTLKNLVATRGAQWFGRVGLMIAIYIAGKFGVKLDDDTAAQVVLVAGIIGVSIAYWLIDRWSHTKQVLDVAARAFDKGADAVVKEVNVMAAGQEILPRVIKPPPDVVVKVAAQNVKNETSIIAKMPPKKT